MIKSLELRWLKPPRDIILPNVLFLQGNYKFGGCFFHPEKKEIFVDNRNYSLENGILVVVDNGSTIKSVASTIAHEFMHFSQYYTYSVFRNRKVATKLDNTIQYENAIKKFFTSDVFEMQALQYAYAKSPYDVTTYWLDILHEVQYGKS